MLSAVILVPSCGTGSSTEPQYRGLVVLNVLDKPLYDDCHIPASVHVPFEEVEEFAAKIEKNAQIVFYCSNYQCSSSWYAAKKLKSMGYSNVSVYEGGMAEWFQAGLPVNGPHQSNYLKRVCKPGTDEEQDVPVIHMQDLAQKMGYSYTENQAAA